MGFDLKFYLNETEIQEPVGYGEVTFSITRSTHHGIGFEASDSALGFYGLAASILQGEKEEHGMLSTVIFRAEQSCNGEQRETIIEGRLNFGKWRETCGTNGCTVYLPIETESCELVLLSRMDNEVDVDKTTTFDNLTPITPYDKLNFPINLPAKNIDTGAVGQVDVAGMTVDTEDFSSQNYRSYVRPAYIVSNGSLTDQQLDAPTNEWADSEPGFDFLTPQVLMNNVAGCTTGSLSLDVRLKGRITDTSLDTRQVYLSVVVGKGEFSNVGGTFPITGGLEIIFQQDILYNVTKLPGEQWFYFDESYSGSITLDDGQGLYAYVFFRSDQGGESTLRMIAEFDHLCTFSLTGTQSCPPSDANVYMVNETLARLTEIISDNCCTVKSNYFGRIDSQPYPFNADGCGSLRFLTSGLKIRRAAEAKFFTSLKKILDGLNCIDNLGYDVVPSGSPYYPPYILRIEPAEYFYQDVELLRCDFIPESELTVKQENCYVKILIGYKKWEVQEIKGAQEINATREYRTLLETISNQLDLTTDLVAGAYAIEITRQQGFVESGDSDTQYDDETFIVCLERGAYGLQVETGNIENVTDVPDSGTLYNARISPARNMMRWYKSIINAYPNITNGNYRICFSSGVGNYRARFKLDSDTCRLEGSALSENGDLWMTNFADAADATPIWRNEVIVFDYPLSIQEYKTIKANPYGYVSFQCSVGDWRKAWIENVEYTPAKGTATFTLKIKWE